MHFYLPTFTFVIIVKIITILNSFCIRLFLIRRSIISRCECIRLFLFRRSHQGMKDSPNIDTFGVSDPWELLLLGGSCSHLGVSDWRPGVTYVWPKTFMTTTMVSCRALYLMAVWKLNDHFHACSSLVGVVLLTSVGVGGGGSYTCLLASFIWLISPLAWLAPLQMTINRHWER